MSKTLIYHEDNSYYRKIIYFLYFCFFILGFFIPDIRNNTEGVNGLFILTPCAGVLMIFFIYSYPRTFCFEYSKGIFVKIYYSLFFLRLKRKRVSIGYVENCVNDDFSIKIDESEMYLFDYSGEDINLVYKKDRLKFNNIDQPIVSFFVISGSSLGCAIRVLLGFMYE